MVMEQVDWERIAELDLSDLVVGDWVMYCPQCLERFEPNVVVSTYCDRCLTTAPEVSLLEKIHGRTRYGAARRVNRHRITVRTQAGLLKHARMRRERDV